MRLVMAEISRSEDMIHYTEDIGLKGYLGMKVIIPAPIWAKTPFLTKWRWVVERTLDWLNRYRRLSKDYKQLVSSSRMWVVISMIGVMVRKLRPS